MPFARDFEEVSINELLSAWGWKEGSNAWGWRRRLMAWEEDSVRERSVLLNNVILQENIQDQ